MSVMHLKRLPTMMHAHHRLFRFGIAILIANTMAAVVAVTLNLPSQFGYVGTDAAADVLSRGTAISAPLLPMVLLAVSLALLRPGSRWHVAGIAGTCLVALLVLIGGVGELVAPATADTPKGVLVAASIAWAGIGLTLLRLAAAAYRARQRPSLPASA